MTDTTPTLPEETEEPKVYFFQSPRFKQAMKATAAVGTAALALIVVKHAVVRKDDSEDDFETVDEGTESEA